ncbi:MAG TPA: hypothetical protein VFN35_08135, partial [Ktedonobacteraceae bacterium]|nr:hypothetical protein [Ktedonobacteraceae bacterium]
MLSPDEIDSVLKTLEQRLNENLTNDQLILNATTVGAADIVQLLGNIVATADPELTITDARITTGPDNRSVTVIGQCILPGNTQACAVQALFEAPDGQLTLKLDLAPGTGTFASSFPELAHSFFDNLILTAPHLVLSSCSYTYLSSDGALQVPIQRGLNFFAQVTIAGVLQSALSILWDSHDAVLLYGTIEVHDDQRDFHLKTQTLVETPTLSLTGMTALVLTDLSLEVESLFATDGQSRNNRAYIYATTDLGIRQRLAIQLPVEQSVWTISLAPDTQAPLTMANLLMMMGGQQVLTTTLPDGLLANLQNLSLSQFSI